MRQLFLTLFLLFGWIHLIIAQDVSFSVEVSTDSLLMGNMIEVKFALKNAHGTAIQTPDFEGFQIVGGPNQSSSFSMINGTTTQEISYTYYLKPIEEGTFYILPASIEVEGEFLETTPIEIIVYPNPDGIIQEMPSKKKQDMFSWDRPFSTPPKAKEKPKKKRKIYKM